MERESAGSISRFWIARFVTLVAVTVAIVAFAVPAVAGEEVVVDGVRYVRNPTEPPEGVVTLELEELWRVGGEDGELLL